VLLAGISYDNKDDVVVIGLNTPTARVTAQLPT
jgi:hypothetical protein